MRALIAVVMLAGCKGDPAPPAPRPPPPVVVRALPSEAIAEWNHDGSWHVTFAKDIRCDRTWKRPDTVTLDLDVSLAADSSRSWSIRGVEGSVTVGELDKTTLELPVTVAAKTLAGSVLAKTCPTREDGPAGWEVRSTATMKVAGVTFPIRGAIERGDGTIVLSSEPRSCSPTWLTRVTLAKKGDRWTLSGGLFGKRHPTGSGAGLTIGTQGDKRVELVLSGQATLDGYAVTLSGTTDVRDCPPPNRVRPQVDIGPDPIGARLGLVRTRAVGHAEGDDDDETIGCEAAHCWARTRSGATLTCRASGMTADYIARGAHGYVEFDRETDSDACTGFMTMAERQ